MNTAKVVTMKPKLLFLVTEDWFFCSHFFERAWSAKAANYEVIVVTRDLERSKKIRNAGFTVIPINFNRRGINPLKDIKVICQLIRIYWKEKPDIVHHIAAKPILYGTIAALLTFKPAILNAPVGMGYIFSMDNRVTRCIRPFLKTAYYFLLNPRKSKVVFENNDDLKSFVSMKAVKLNDAILIRGAGVDTTIFQRRSVEPSGIPVITLVSRMLWDKGISEFITAANIINKGNNIQARFILVGDPDDDNPSAISRENLKSWHGVNGVEWWGWREDVAEVLNATHIACLPSYREGLPKSLLEAAAVGLPIVTTDTVGCRDVVRDGQNGFLVPIKNAQLLAANLKKLIYDPNLRLKMGLESRLIAENLFSSERIINETLVIYKDLLSKKS
jgi:glycosyltransferase involved in cell wall biosynthesis